MRLVIDLQGAQGSSRRRGIGRYSLALAKGLARNRAKHEVVIALNGYFEDSIGPLREEFADLLPPENVVTWGAPAAFHPVGGTHAQRSHTLEAFRESALSSCRPDFVLVTSLFEGDNAITSVGKHDTGVPTAVVLYDLIPLIHKRLYLPRPHQEASYAAKLEQMKKADLLLAISESSRREALEHLGFGERDAVNISSAADPHFSPEKLDQKTRKRLAETYGIVRPFVMYTGGVDHRKNINGLIAAYASVPQEVRKQHQLAIVCSLRPAERKRIVQQAAKAGLGKDELVLTGYVPEEDLLACYRDCKLFVFPSWHEGFGLPVLEAMMCGRAVIAGNKSSLPEVVGREDAMFDPHDARAIGARIADVLGDDRLRAELEQYGLERAKLFSWDDTARRAWAALERSNARMKRGRGAAS